MNKDKQFLRAPAELIDLGPVQSACRTRSEPAHSDISSNLNTNPNLSR
jgi:hypothetical protein